jgi:hypothetical protein
LDGEIRAILETMTPEMEEIDEGTRDDGLMI